MNHPLIVDLFKAVRPLKFVQKVWGTEIWIVNTEKYCSKILDLYPGFQCSIHRHLVKAETFWVLDGECTLEFFTEAGVPISDYELAAGNQVFIPVGTFHRFKSNQGALIQEFSTTHSDEDVERLEESGPIPNECSRQDT